MANPLPLVASPGLAQQVEALERDGFVCLPGVLTPDDIAALRNSMDRLEARPENYDRHQTPAEGGFLNKSINNVFNRERLYLPYLDRAGIIAI
ncbi:MAG: phytanoyl-CoA dioxygenase family protein, partial [Candidatus Latescibacteria bacterium]|nr:phytanoyl-CoA dioxygenase family protein [Candidatus Latescibacterota bacterium]